MADRVFPAFEGRILSVDGPVALCCAALHIPDPRSDRDALIAATGITHAMPIVTRNVADFEPTGVQIINPWEPMK
jgi:predicted nucleic acid-binding protein